MNLNEFIQILAWAYFWVGSIVIGFYGWISLTYLIGWRKSVVVPFNWRVVLFLIFWLVSMKLK